MHRKAKIDPINITLYNRGNKTKAKIINTLHDEDYTTLVTNNNRETHNHQWFRKPHTELNKIPPEPQYTQQ